MMNARALELIHGAIDGTHSTSDANEFDQLMTSSEEARGMYASLSKLSGILEETPQLDVPGDLRGRILDAVERSKSEDGAAGQPAVTPFPSSSNVASMRTVRGKRASGSWPGYAAAAAAGLLLGVLGVTWISEQSEIDPADTIATLAPRPADSDLLGGVWPEGADPTKTTGDGIQGRLGVALQLEAAQLGVGTDGDHHVVNVTGDTRDWDSLTLTFDPLQLEFEGLTSNAAKALSADTSVAGQTRILLSDSAEFEAMFSSVNPGSADQALNAEIKFSVERDDGSAVDGTLYLAR